MNERSSRSDAGGVIIGLVFVVLGIAFLLDRLDVWSLDLGLVWPVLLIALGASILLSGLLRRRSGDGPAS